MVSLRPGEHPNDEEHICQSSTTAVQSTSDRIYEVQIIMNKLVCRHVINLYKATSHLSYPA